MKRFSLFIVMFLCLFYKWCVWSSPVFQPSRRVGQARPIVLYNKMLLKLFPSQVLGYCCCLWRGAKKNYNLSLSQYGKVTPVLYWSRMSHKSVLCSLWILWLLQKMMIHASWIWRIDIFLSSTDAAEIIDKVSSKINIIRLSWFSGMHIKVYPVYRMSHIICPSYSVLLGRMSYFCPYPFLQSFLFPVCCLFVFHLAQVCCLQLKRQLIAV